jgi:hypothetical protein
MWAIVIRISNPAQGDSKFHTVIFQFLYHIGSHGVRERKGLVLCRDNVVHGCHDPIGRMHPESAGAQPLESLRRSDFVNQMQVDVQNGRAIGLGSYHMGFPDLFEQCFWFHGSKLPAMHATGHSLFTEQSSDAGKRDCVKKEKWEQE